MEDGLAKKSFSIFLDDPRRQALDFLMGFRLEKKEKGGRKEKKLVVNPRKSPPNEQFFPSFMVFRP